MTLSRVVARCLVVSLVGLAAACGPEAPAPPATTGGDTPVDAATAGSLSGQVTFTGEAPRAEPLPMRADPACVAAAGSDAVSDAVLVGASGGLQNVFVYVKDGLDPKYSFPAPTDAVLLDQAGCRYRPRVLGVQVGQPLETINSDDTLHNVHGMPTKNVEFNVSQPVKGRRLTTVFTTPEVMVRFKCNVHSWMAAYVGVLPHPYFAVTAGDGSFSIPGLPPGTYTIEAWHEVFGTQTQQITIGERESGTVAFSFQAG